MNKEILTLFIKVGAKTLAFLSTEHALDYGVENTIKVEIEIVKGSFYIDKEEMTFQYRLANNQELYTFSIDGTLLSRSSVVGST